MNPTMYDNNPDYWHITARGMEFVWLLGKLVLRTMAAQPTAPMDAGVVMQLGDGSTKFYIMKKYLPVEELAKVTGLSVAALTEAGGATLKIKERPELPSPNVDYVGEA